MKKDFDMISWNNYHIKSQAPFFADSILVLKP